MASIVPMASSMPARLLSIAWNGVVFDPVTYDAIALDMPSLSAQYTDVELRAAVLATNTINVARSESPTRTIIGCRDCPVTMRKPWNMIQTVSTVTAT